MPNVPSAFALQDPSQHHGLAAQGSPTGTHSPESCATPLQSHGVYAVPWVLQDWRPHAPSSHWQVRVSPAVHPPSGKYEVGWSTAASAIPPEPGVDVPPVPTLPPVRTRDASLNTAPPEPSPDPPVDEPGFPNSEPCPSSSPEHARNPRISPTAIAAPRANMHEVYGAARGRTTKGGSMPRRPP